ncbi:response regulator transcription factor [Candidatus Kaiserbacteria bacterium]|nr:response regulator transcription factor [Candidatus Kaiserbacteria bacterium]
MSESASSESGKWQNESDKSPHVVSIESEAALLRLKETSSSEGILVVHGNGGLLNSASDVARFVREDCKLSVPLVYLSNNPVSEREKIQFFDTGGDAILIGHDQTLLPKILIAIRRRQRLFEQSRKVIKPFDGLTIDTAKAMLMVKGNSVKITASECRMIGLLAEAYPKYVTKERIAEELHFGDEGTENVTQQCATRLRKKISPLHKFRYIWHSGNC